MEWEQSGLVRCVWYSQRHNTGLRFREVCKSQTHLFPVIMTGASWDKVGIRAPGLSWLKPVSMPWFSYIYMMFLFPCLLL